MQLQLLWLSVVVFLRPLLKLPAFCFEKTTWKVRRKSGRPPGLGKGKSEAEKLAGGLGAPTEGTRNRAPSTSQPPKVSTPTPATTPRQRDPGSTSSRPSYYLLGKPPTSLLNSKLPKSGPVLGRLLSELETKSLTEASKVVAKEVKDVWLHHFGPKLILGKEYGKEEDEKIDLELKMIKSDQKVAEKVVEVYKKWRNMEYESRRPQRAETKSFLAKKKELEVILDSPLEHTVDMATLFISF